MATPFLAEVKIISWNFPPKYWAFCNGQLLPINQNQALFSLLGTMYGGDGQTTFALPNLQGRVPLHVGNGHTQGETGGEEHHTVITTELPAHTHLAAASTATGTTPLPANDLLAATAANIYTSSTTDPTTLVPATITNVGGSQPHNNLQPYLVLNFVIALQGIFPSRN